MKLVLKSRVSVAIVATVITASVVGGVAWAAQSPTSDTGIIYACYNPSTGAFRLRVTTACPSTGMTVPISWNLAGVPGVDGMDGVAGTDGVDGQPGLPGVAGVAGEAGVDGPIGATGPQGPLGPVGPAGPRGADGARGSDGVAGPAGAEGVAGIAGIDGAEGPQGPEGPAGPEGPRGLDGLRGIDGSDGVDGPQGLPGIAGVDGLDGEVGPQGPQGLQGIQGPAGADGTSLVAVSTVAENWGTTQISGSTSTLFQGWPIRLAPKLPLRTVATFVQPANTTQVFRGWVSTDGYVNNCIANVAGTTQEFWQPELTLKVTIDGSTIETYLVTSGVGLSEIQFDVPIAMFSEAEETNHTISILGKLNCMFAEIMVTGLTIIAYTISG